MRILFISNLYPLPWQPGRGVFNHAMIDALRAAGHHVDVIVPVNLMERVLAPRRGVSATVPPATPVRYVVPPRLLRQHYHRMIWWGAGAAMRRLARAARPDAILAFWLHPDAAVAQRLGRELGVPVVPMAGGSDLLVITRDARRRAAVQRVLRDAPAILTNGSTLRQAAIDLGAPPDRVHAFRRGVDTGRFHHGDRIADRAALGIRDASRLLVFAGNLVTVKGPDLLLAALVKCDPAMPWDVAWIGDGPMQATLEASAHAAGIAGRMRFVGRVRQEELPAWYRAADLVALTSRSEGIPNVLLEAMACGTPFVAFDVGGVREIAPDPAWLVPSGNVVALARALDAAWPAPTRVDLPAPRKEAMVATIIGALRAATSGERS